MGKLNHKILVIPTGGFFLEILRYIFSIEKVGTTIFNAMGKRIYRPVVTIPSTGKIARHHYPPHHLIYSSAIFYIRFNQKGHSRVQLRIFSIEFELPISMQGIFSLDILEFIAAKIKIFITLEVLQVDKMEDVIKMHCFIDSSSALFWMQHSNFNTIRDKAHDKLERSLAR